VTQSPRQRLRFLIRKGLDLPLDGAPAETIDDGVHVRSVALLGEDYPGLKPSLTVREGDRVRLGQALFHDRAHPEILFTSPGAGVVRAIHRGARRSLVSVVVDLDGLEEVHFDAIRRNQLPALDSAVVRDTLLRSGLWTSLRERPFGNVAVPDRQPHAVFVTAIDTHPLSPPPLQAIHDHRDEFADGLIALTRLVEAPIFLCTTPAADLPAVDRVTLVEISGPHPAGLVGTHIHLLSPVGLTRTAWHIGYQDVIAIGRLLTTGRLAVDRVVSLGGPAVERPRLLRTRLGASIDDLSRDNTQLGARVLSGSVLAGRTASGPNAFLGRYHNQISALWDPETRARRVGGWSFYGLGPWRRRLPLTTAVQGPARALLPVDTFEKVMPLKLLPTPLFRALLVGDLEMAEGLGCLELEEEDLALCTFLCPAKIDYGTALRAVLNQMWKEV
jgi:Na+-transporting NADH:ubiquinone oxidoreductase subunit A